MIPGENETQLASGKPSPKLPRLGEVVPLSGSIIYPWCRLLVPSHVEKEEETNFHQAQKVPFHTEQEQEISTCWASTSQDPN